MRDCSTGITSTITTADFIKNKGTCDDSVSCDFLTAQVSFEKEFFFFDKFTVPNGCGVITYTLNESPSGTQTSTAIATVDEIALVPNKMRIFFKDASVIGNTAFTVVGTNPFGIAITS